mmetsp:Transcript_31361/g.90049  ORF Transcript_31361/g.90049 Transcript_31361/m.90049 type:complete len:202 (+) Transcript_31361:119-724(+)
MGRRCLAQLRAGIQRDGGRQCAAQFPGQCAAQCPGRRALAQCLQGAVRGGRDVPWPPLPHRFPPVLARSLCCGPPLASGRCGVPALQRPWGASSVCHAAIGHRGAGRAAEGCGRPWADAGSNEGCGHGRIHGRRVVGHHGAQTEGVQIWRLCGARCHGQGPRLEDAMRDFVPPVRRKRRRRLQHLTATLCLQCEGHLVSRR